MNSKIISGSLSATGQKIVIITARFNDLVTDKLRLGAIDCLVRHGMNEADITQAWVPGAFELPLAAQAFAKQEQYSAIICLGAVIRGGTPHFEYVCSEVAKGVSRVALDFHIPVTFGVLTTDNLDQALERSGAKGGNKGWEAAITAIEMSTLLEQIPSKNED